MPQVHSSSVIGPDVELADDVVIGPQCTLDGRIRIGAGTTLRGHNYLTGPLEIGRNNRIYPFACLGFEPQDYKFDPEAPCAGLRIGDDNIFRESVTVHRSTSSDRPTAIGHRNFFMVGSHVGHDCMVGSSCVLVNGAMLAGHATLDDRVTMGGGAGVAQHRRVGRLSFIGGTIGVTQHVPPFTYMRMHNRAGGVNVIGMRRNGFSSDEIDQARWAFRVLYRESSSRSNVLERLGERAEQSPVVREILDFMQSINGPICKPERLNEPELE